MAWSIYMITLDTLASVLDYTGISVRKLEFCFVHRLSQFEAEFAFLHVVPLCPRTRISQFCYCLHSARTVRRSV